MAQTLGPYALGKPHGALPFGDLFEAIRPGRRERFAILMVSDDLAADQRLRGLLRLEVSRAAGLHHPAVARPIEVGVGLLSAIEAAELGDAIGTRINRAYIAPEQRAGRRAVASADGYALGALAHVLLIGVAPPDAVDDADPTDDLAAATDGLTMMGAVLRRQLNRRPDRRYPSCVAFATALADALGLPVASSGELPRDPPPTPTPLDPPTTSSAAEVAPVAGPRPPAAGPRPTPASVPSDTTPAPSDAAPASSGHSSAFRSVRPRGTSRTVGAPPELQARLQRLHRGTVSRSVLRGSPLVGCLTIIFIGLALPSVAAWPMSAAIAAVIAMLAVGAVMVSYERRQLGKDVEAGQLRVIDGPVDLERERLRHIEYRLCLHDAHRIVIREHLFERLRPLAHDPPRGSTLERLTEALTVYRIDRLTVVILPCSERIVEIRDERDEPIYRDPDLPGGDLGVA